MRCIATTRLLTLTPTAMIQSLKSRRRKNPLLWTVIGLSLAVHVVALLIFGSFVLMKGIEPKEENIFVGITPESISPAALLPALQLDRNTRASSRPNPRIIVSDTPDFALATVELSPQAMRPPMIPVNPTQHNPGGTSGFGEGLARTTGVPITIFEKIPVNAESFVIAIDTNPTLMRDERGGLYTYRVIKHELARLLDQLPSGVLFNIMLYNSEGHNRTVNLFQPHLVAATATNKRMAIEWMVPVNEDPARLGPGNNNFRPEAFIEPVGKHLHGDLWALQAAMEQKPQAIYFVTGNWPDFSRVQRPFTEQEQAAYEKRREDYEQRFQTRLSARDRDIYEQARQDAVARNQASMQRAQAWIKAENERRAKRGLPPMVAVHWHEVARQQGFPVVHPEQVALAALSDSARNRLEGARPNRGTVYFEPRQVERHFQELSKVLYAVDRKASPSINLVVLLGKDEAWSQEQNRRLAHYVRQHDGQFRVIRGLGSIDEKTTGEDLSQQLAELSQSK